MVRRIDMDYESYEKVSFGTFLKRKHELIRSSV